MTTHASSIWCCVAWLFRSRSRQRQTTCKVLQAEYNLQVEEKTFQWISVPLQYPHQYWPILEKQSSGICDISKSGTGGTLIRMAACYLNEITVAVTACTLIMLNADEL